MIVFDGGWLYQKWYTQKLIRVLSQKKLKSVLAVKEFCCDCDDDM